MNKNLAFRAFLILVCAVMALVALPAAAGDAPTLCGATGHYYAFIESDPLTWSEAETAASGQLFEDLTGHLATITCQAEQDCVQALVRPDDAWLGGFQPPDTPEPNDGWEWVTGETWNYTNWNEGEPNDDGGQDCLQIYDLPDDGQWDDLECDGEGEIDAYIVEWEPEGAPGCPEDGAESRATFAVTKDFNDGNQAEVEVTISCNTGLPLQQTTGIAEGDGVVFVVTDFESGTMDCSVTEELVAGYSVNYNNGTVNSDVSCEFEDVAFGEANSCTITNSLLTVEVVVTKEWIDENPQFAAVNIAEAEWECSNVAFGNDGGFLGFLGNPASDSFFVFPDWDGGTTCSITEVQIPDGGVEVDDTDCQGLLVLPGEGAECTIVNTRFFEGIPTLSQYGLALLAMLMLGIGFVAFRRVG